MRDHNSNKTKLSWSKRMVRKLFNIKSESEDPPHQPQHALAHNGGGYLSFSTNNSSNYNSIILSLSSARVHNIISVFLVGCR
ncbi:hypothetical protein Lalb_Chr05g0211121 [Lupinus albus]|uniref:Uncharacterized protein n=1 Tax=Lupinus albus TaxID=3870 RepID=A0A6A4QGY0_LUPAL|nr:hypothetical protein Lalb_Chr05g0211121 [Lupinus albus]